MCQPSWFCKIFIMIKFQRYGYGICILAGVFTLGFTLKIANQQQMMVQTGSYKRPWSIKSFEVNRVYDSETFLYNELFYYALSVVFIIYGFYGLVKTKRKN